MKIKPKPVYSYIRVFMLGIVLLISACQPQTDLATISPQASATEDLRILAQSRSQIATAVVIASSTATVQPSATPTASPSPLPSATPSWTPVPSQIVVMPVLPATAEAPAQTSALSESLKWPPDDHYNLSRPIARSDTLTDWPDRTYLYGSTQQGALEVHLGVEFVNPRFTAVLSGGDGRVVYAGTDEARQIGPALGYYGNVVIIEHDQQSPLGEPVYTLYGHLQRIDVETDQRVRDGQQVGQIGDSGIAYGPHLHFEVRLGGDAFDYRSTRNPELWLRPYPGFGTIAGRVEIASDEPVYGLRLLVRNRVVTRDVITYESDRVNADTAWRENFVVGDLPAGAYDVIISSSNGQVFFRETFDVQAGQTSWVEASLGSQPDQE